MPPTNESAPQAKKRKKDRACDACRRRKTKCDGPWMPNNLCSNCIQTRKPCTYVEASKPRGPPKAYVTGLEDRIEALEALLQQIRPDADFSEELGPPVLRNSWKSQDGPSTASSSNSATRKSSFTTHALPPLAIPFSTHRNQPSIPAPLISPSPLSTHLRFHSQRAKRPRDATLFAYRDTYDLSDEDSSSESSSSEEETEEIVITSLVGRTKITLRASENDDSAKDYNIRFHGRSSTAGLVEATRQFKYMHMKETMSQVGEENTSPTSPDNSTVAQTRRPGFWQTPAWELAHEGAPVDDPEVLQTFLDRFPPPDLAEILIELYFRHSNSIFPLLHRPTFDRQWREQLHLRNIWFACVCLSIFAIAGRWCHDERVLPEISVQTKGNIDWRIAGRHYFEMAMEIHRVRRSLFHPASLLEVQSFALMAMYLRGTAAYPAAWLVVSVGIRKAQDVGAHRKRVYRGVPNIDDELWKRAFWHLVVFDRLGGARLGRACGLAEEDFDLDLPLEVDDDYWEATQDGYGPFKQPSGMPSKVTAFNEFIKITQIMAFAMRTLYAIDKSQVYRGIIPLERENLVKQLSLAMDEWKENIPEHLVWQDKMDVSVFSDQSSTLFTTFYFTRILVHRPLMATSAPYSPFEKGPGNLSDFEASISDPAILICSEAASSCARIVEFQLQHGIHHFNVPNTIGVSHACAAFLLLTAWKLKIQERDLRRSGTLDIKPPVAQRIEQKVIDVKIFLQALEASKPRWATVDSLLEELNESLHGLESQNSDANASHPFGDNFKSNTPYSKTVRDDPWSQMQSGSNLTQLPIQHEYSYNSSPSRTEHLPSRATPSFKNYDAVADLELHTFSDTEPLVHIRLPQAQSISARLTDSDLGQWPSHGTSYPNFEPHSAPVTLNGRTRAISVSTAPWSDRSLPFISSMRRTSHPNLSQREKESQNSDQVEALRSRIPSQSLSAGSQSTFNGPVRYEDVNMHRDDDELLTNRSYAQHGYHQAPPSKYSNGSSRGTYDKSGYHRQDGWNHPLTRNHRNDRPTLTAWTGPTTVSATPYPHSHYQPPSQDEHHDPTRSL